MFMQPEKYSNVIALYDLKKIISRESYVPESFSLLGIKQAQPALCLIGMFKLAGISGALSLPAITLAGLKCSQEADFFWGILIYF